MSTLKIESLSSTGLGVGRLDDLVVFVEMAVPGDVVEVEIVSQKKNYAQARIKKLIEASKSRRDPPCPVYGSCGGCQLQHMSYPEQLKQKQNIVEHNLKRIAKEEQVPFSPIVASPQEWHYRNRAQFRLEGTQAGFYKRKSHSIVDIESCMLLEPALNQALMELREQLKAEPSASLQKLEYYLDSKNQIHSSKNRSHGEELGFSQVNTLQNQKMVEFVSEAFGEPTTPGQDLLDLYCGNGNFSFPLNQKGWRLYGVDMNRRAIQQARTKATETTFFSVNDCLLEARKLVQNNRKFGAILIDPPRIGADERLWPWIRDLKPEKLVYVSCNPATFARDWARIKSTFPKGSIQLTGLQPFDMFPQTFHVELVAVAAISHN